MTIFSEQYQTPCVVYDGQTAERLLTECFEVEALFFEEGPENPPCFVVQFRDDVGPEIWTQEAIRRSAKADEKYQ